MIRSLRSAKLFLPSLIISAFTLGAIASNRLSSGEARKLIATAGGITFNANDVHIRRIDLGPGGGSAVVEALVQVAFRFTQRGGQWQVAEIRLGDRRWDDIEFIRTAVDKEKTRITRENLTTVAAALQSYRREHGEYPKGKDFAALMDALLPKYLTRIIREDAWDRPLVLENRPSGLRLISWGPDGRAGTEDDIVVETQP